MAEFLKANPPEPSATGSNALHTVRLTADAGYFRLHWESAFLGKWDWIGLYKNTSDSDEHWISGNNWQWASAGSSYHTSTKASSGFQVRYLVWDYREGKYMSVARASLS